jgi:hypothetical protein
LGLGGDAAQGHELLLVLPQVQCIVVVLQTQ